VIGNRISIILFARLSQRIRLASHTPAGFLTARRRLLACVPRNLAIIRKVLCRRHMWVEATQERCQMTEETRDRRRTGWAAGMRLADWSRGRFHRASERELHLDGYLLQSGLPFAPARDAIWVQSAHYSNRHGIVGFTATDCHCPQAESNTSRKRPAWAPTMPTLRCSATFQGRLARERKLDARSPSVRRELHPVSQ